MKNERSPIQPSLSELWTTPRASGDLRNYADKAPSSPNPTFRVGIVDDSKSLRRLPKLRRQGTQLAQSNLPYRNCRGVLCAAEHGRPHRSTADHTGARQTTQEHGARQNRRTAEHPGARQNTPRTHADMRATTYLRGRLIQSLLHMLGELDRRALAADILRKSGGARQRKKKHGTE